MLWARSRVKIPGRRSKGRWFWWRALCSTSTTTLPQRLTVSASFSAKECLSNLSVLFMLTLVILLLFSLLQWYTYYTCHFLLLSSTWLLVSTNFIIFVYIFLIKLYINRSYICLVYTKYTTHTPYTVQDDQDTTSTWAPLFHRLV